MSPSPSAPDTTQPAGFASLGLVPELLGALAALGYEEPTPIQREAIPPLLAGRDLLGQAATGTGKTAAFALPLLQLCAAEEPGANKPAALVLVPTRELAMQVSEAVHRYGRERHARVLPIYGGQDFRQQLRALDRGVHVVVGTPGRALDHLTRGSLDPERVRMVVLDEADEMLDMGFADELQAILERLPKPRQTALFSATMAPRILAIARQHLCDPVNVSIERERAAPGELPRVRQAAYLVLRAHKAQALARVLDMETPTSAMVFCRTRVEVDELCEAMNAHGYRAEALHGGFAQEQRDRVMVRFRSGKADLLVATDVAARGLDIEHVSHVVNFDVPTEPEAYVHRIGRTGRAGREGVAITLVEPREQRLLRNIQHATGQPIALETLPTVADLRNRRLELTRASLRETLLAGGLDVYRQLATELASEHDPMDVAAAAVKLAHLAAHESSDASGAEADLPLVTPAPEFREPRRGPGRGRGFEARGGFDERRGSGPRGGFEERRGRKSAARGPGAHGFEVARLFVGAGRIDSLRPGDLVGAIANEAGIDGQAIGAIRIADRFALVEVPEEFAEIVIQALRRTQIRGRRVTVRRDLMA